MNIAYPLFPVTVITILAYFTTWLFSKWDIFTVKSHRKFWNYLLLISFLISGLLGMLSVVKVNYKLQIPIYDTLMQWHVAFGIAMVIISFFHLSWHLKYYFTFNKKAIPVQSKPLEMQENNLEKFRYLLVILGVVAVINQVVFIREFISVLSGNELVLGIVMASWMLITGWGAFSGRKSNFSKLSLKRGISMLGALTIMPVFMVALLYWLKNQLFPPGTMVSIGISVIASVLILFPFCYLSGYLFTALSSVYSELKKENLTGKAYSLESAGSLIGGLIFSLLVGRFFNSFQIFGITTAIVFISGTLLLKKTTDFKTHSPHTHKSVSPLSFKERGRVSQMADDGVSNNNSIKKAALFNTIFLIIIGLLMPLLIFVFNPDNFIKKMLFPNQQIIVNKSTRYGNLVVTKQAGQLNVFENNDLQFYTENMMLNEEAVHFAMVQHKNPHKVLLVSGGISGMIKELEKYPVDKISYLEINPEIFNSLNKLDTTGLNFANIEIVKSDIRAFISKSDTKYDVILLNLPPPSSLGLNRFYTEEFFKNIKKHCNDETVICTILPTTANYAEENALEVNSSLLKTLRIYFKNTLILTGEKNYFLASNQQLSANIAEKIADKGIVNEYVNQYYFDDALLAARSQTLTAQINPDAPINRDFSPFMFIKQISHWLSHFGTSYKIIVIIPALLFFLLFAKTNRVTAGLYTGGFTAASLEVTLMLAYQIYFGSLYLATAFFFAVFMAGLAWGSSVNLKSGISPFNNYYKLQFGLAAFAIALPFLIQFIGLFAGWKLPAQFLFFVLIFTLAFGIGFEFLLASKLQPNSYSETSGINYSTDLAGSAFGAFLTAIVLIPLAGLVYTCFIVAVLNIFSGSLAFSIRKTSIF